MAVNGINNNNDSAEFGQMWIYNNSVWVYTSSTTWTLIS